MPGGEAPQDAVPRAAAGVAGAWSGAAPPPPLTVTAPGAGAEEGLAARIAAALDGIGPVLGVDAGGTGTRAALVSGGVARQRYSTGPFNFLLQDDGVPRMAALARAAQPSAVGIGVPGIAREPGAAAAFAAAVSAACGVPTRVDSDATVAWLGAFLGGPGIVVIAGTGSVAVGGSAGALRRVGGHGYLVGDEGSGYWIGRTALRAALAGAEGTGPPTRLGDALAQAARSSLDELVLRVQRAPTDRTVLTGLAPVVGECAAGPDGDPVAQTIIADAAAALAGLAHALRRQLGGPPGTGHRAPPGAGRGAPPGTGRGAPPGAGRSAPPGAGRGEPPGARASDLPVAWAGGVFAIPALWAAFQRSTAAVPPLAPPEIGAALLAAAQDEWPGRMTSSAADAVSSPERGHGPDPRPAAW